jgi:hypothetical protein
MRAPGGVWAPTSKTAGQVGKRCRNDCRSAEWRGGLCVEWAESRVTGRNGGNARNANATDSNRASPRCKRCGFWRQKKGEAGGRKDLVLQRAASGRAARVGGHWWTGGRPGICDYYPALPDLGMDWGVTTRGGLIQGCKARCSRRNPPGAGCRHRRKREHCCALRRYSL